MMPPTKNDPEPNELSHSASMTEDSNLAAPPTDSASERDDPIGAPRRSARWLILVCTYNERETLPQLVDQIQSVLPHADLLVVDDHSPDGTANWVRQRQEQDPRVQLIERSGKLGLGTAIRDGMQYAIANHYSWVINLDGDLSHDPSVMKKMVALQDSCDLAIGSRYVPGGGMLGCSWRRILVSRFANTLARWIVGWSISDCSSAYRMYRVDCLKAIQLHALKETGYGFLEEILAHLIRVGARVTEVPIVYQERRLGHSKISPREGYSALSALFRCARILRAPRSSSASGQG
jgi:dolichol-phosphate mannosyltransferase